MATRRVRGCESQGLAATALPGQGAGDGPGMGRDAPAAHAGEGTRPWKHLLSQRCHLLRPGSAAPARSAALLFPAWLRNGAKGRKTRRLNLWKRQEGAQQGLALFSGSRPQEVREQAVKHLMIYLRNEPPQLEIPGDLHTPRAETLPCTLLRINPPLGKSPGASCHVQTHWVHTNTFIFWISLFFPLPPEISEL